MFRRMALENVEVQQNVVHDNTALSKVVYLGHKCIDYDALLNKISKAKSLNSVKCLKH